ICSTWNIYRRIQKMRRDRRSLEKSNRRFRRNINRDHTKRVNQQYQEQQDDYKQQLHQFNYRFKQPSLIRAFEQMLKDSGINEIFSNVRMNKKPIPVSYTEARSTVASYGKSNTVLRNISNTIHMQQPNLKKLHKVTMQQEIFKIISDNATSFTKLINELEKYFNRLADEQFQWNIVYYQDYEKD